jgi:hypothetical protein
VSSEIAPYDFVAAATISVTVVNPTPGEGVSSALPFTVDPAPETGGTIFLPFVVRGQR